MSCVHESRYLSDSVYVVVKGQNCFNYHEIEFHKNRSSCSLWCMHYMSISVRMTVSFSHQHLTDVDTNLFASCFCVSREYRNSIVYQSFTSDWLYRQIDGKFSLPVISSDLDELIFEYMS